MKMHNLWGKLYVLALFGVMLLVISIHEGRFLGYELKQKPAEEQTTRAFTLEEAEKLLPGAAQIEYLAADEALVSDQAGRKLGRLLHTQPLARHITGYGSWLPIVIGLNADERVTGLLLQKNDETPGFIKRLTKAGFFDAWNGQNASDAASLPVDAISRATMTSKATIDSVRLRLARFLEIEQLRQQIDYRAVAIEAVAWVFLLVAFSGCFASAWLGRHRKLFLLAAIIVPGFVLGRFFSVELLYAWAINGVPWQNQLFLAMVVLLAVAIPLFTGRSWYCTWYCPYGAAQELAGGFCKRKIDFTGPRASFVRHLRPAFLAIVVLMLVVGYKISLNSLEPFSAFLLSSASTTVMVLAVVFLVLSLIIRRPWCNYFCPSGQIVEMLRVGLADQTQILEGKEAREVKIHAVVNLLLAIAIIILLMSPARIANNGDKGNVVIQATGEVKMSADNTGVASPTIQPAASVSVNQTLATIYERKSVRSFTGADVSREELTEMVKAGMAAPTARNRQPWQFVVVSDKVAMSNLAEKLPYAKMLASAGAAIVVCGDLEIAKAGDTEGMWMLDCSAATQNILLAAESMGLGAVWTAAFPYADRIAVVTEVLSLPPHVVPLCVIPIGRPSGSDKPKDKWKPERMHWNSFTPASGTAEQK